MLNRTELLLNYPYDYTNEQVQKLVSWGVSVGVGGLSIAPCFLDVIQEIEVRPKIYVNLEWHNNRLNKVLREDLLLSVLKNYGHFVDGINISPNLQHWKENNLDCIGKETEEFIEKCGQFDVEYRALFNYYKLYKNYEDLKNMFGVWEQAGVKTVVIGTSKPSMYQIDDLLLDHAIIARNNNLKYGLFGDIPSVEHLARYTKDFCPVMLTPSIISNLFLN